MFPDVTVLGLYLDMVPHVDTGVVNSSASQDVGFFLHQIVSPLR